MSAGALKKFFKEIPAVIYFLLLVHFVFALSYSGNMTGDAINYYDMILGYSSNLIHAGGYPYLMSRLLGRWARFDWVARTFSNGPMIRSYLFILVQHLVLVLGFLPLHRILKNIFGNVFANWAIAAMGFQWGLMVMASVFFPEWLQVTLLIISFCWIWNSRLQSQLVPKIIYYSAAGFIFACSYLTKFNSMYFISIFLLIWILDPYSWKKKLLVLACFSTSFVGVTSYFKNVPHKQTTGTTDLSYDHAWVLLFRTGMYLKDPQRLKEAGINSKRLYLLNSILPWDMAAANPIYEISQISKEAPQYRANYGYILNLENAKLDELLKLTPPPKDWIWPYAFAPVSYHIGWKEGDELGIAVFKECATHFPWLYLKSVLSQSLRDVLANESFNYLPLEISENSHFYPRGWGLFELRDPDWSLPGNPNRFHNNLGYFVFKPTADIFATWIEVNRLIPYFLFSILTLLAGGIAAVKLVQKKGDRREWFVLITFVTACGYIVFSEAVYEFRWDKEMMMQIPLVCICSVYSLGYLFRKIRAGIV